MHSRNRITWTSVALGVALTVSAPPTSAFAQARGQRGAPAAGAGAPDGQNGRGGRGAGAPLYTPAAGAKDLKSVLFWPC